MSIENNPFDLRVNQEVELKKEENRNQKLEDYLSQLKDDGIETLSPESIKEQLNKIGTAIITRDFGCGIRISKIYQRNIGEIYRTWTTNDLEDRKNPLAQKYGLKEIDIG